MISKLIAPIWTKSAPQNQRDAKKLARANPHALHFLHIGKCAGTQIARVIGQINKSEGKASIIKHNHEMFLRGLPAHARFFFSIREPISRFRSGFYSRKRKGQPRVFREWSAYEDVAFARFEDANDLAEALFEDGRRGLDAAAAIKSIRHTAQNQVDWFYGCGSFLSVREPVWIIRQGCFEDDLDRFLIAAGYDHLRGKLKLTTNAAQAHANNYDGTPPLSEKAKDNLRIWYAQDIQFYRLCEAWLDSKLNQGASA